MTPTPLGERFSRQRRLLTPRAFSRVMESPALKIHQPGFLLLVTPAEGPEPRLGFIVAKRKIPLAVHRNRFKRCFRDAFRRSADQLGAVDVVCLVRQNLSDVSNEQLHERMQQALRRLPRRS